jgi:hypothetical protein
MKTIVVMMSVSLLLAACGDSERPLTAACRPAVSVVMAAASAPHRNAKSAAAASKPATAMPPGTSTPAAASAASAEEPRREAVQVYWDVSKSMRDFATARAAHGDVAEETDDLTPVVAALDSSVLLRAHAEVVEQFGVGESIAPLPSARAALHPKANATMLHLAAEQIGSALAAGSAQAALVVSDLELDAPPRTSVADATVCGGVPLPSVAEAGSLFGRCFENAVLAAKGSSAVHKNLLVHVFRKQTHGRELFILLLATDPAFGRRISAEVVRRLDFERQVLFDAGAVSAANVRGCRLAASAPGVQFRSAGCSAKCFDSDATIQAQCDLRRPADDAWIRPAGRGIDGASYESLSKRADDREEPATVRFAIPCSARPGLFESSVSFTWRARTPWSQDGNGAIAQKASVRDLFDSLTDAIVRVVAPRQLRIGIELAR